MVVLSAVETGPCARVGAGRAAADGHDRRAAARPPTLTSISARPAHGRSQHLPACRAVSRRATGPSWRSVTTAPQRPSTGRAAILVHGSSGGSRRHIHALAEAIAARGVETFAVDMRGHGASGTRGDIGYLGQLEDDLADLVGRSAPRGRSAPLTLVGHSVGRRLCAARRRLADPGSVHAHRAACAVSRQRCPLQPAEFRRLGQSEHSAHHRPVRAALARDHLLRIAAGDRVRGAGEFGEGADRGLFVPPVRQFRRRSRLSQVSRCCDAAP